MQLRVQNYFVNKEGLYQPTGPDGDKLCPLRSWSRIFLCKSQM